MRKLKSAIAVLAVAALALPGRRVGRLPGQDHDPRGHDHADREAGQDRLAVADLDRGSLHGRRRPAGARGRRPVVVPRSAPRTKLSGFTPNVEAIAKDKPDLVIISNDSGCKLAKRLKALKIPVMLEPAAAKLADVYAQINQLGSRPGHAEGQGRRREDEGADRSDRRSVPKRPTPLTYYHELSPDLYSATSSTFIGQVYGLLGSRTSPTRPTSPAPIPAAEREYLIAANPDFVFLADTICCQQNAATVAARPGWAASTPSRTAASSSSTTTSPRAGGPRIVSYLAIVAQRVAQAK